MPEPKRLHYEKSPTRNRVAILPNGARDSGVERELPASRDYLRRLPLQHYAGRAMVHWSLTVDQRRTGWLNFHAHRIWREVLLHVGARYRVAAPVYCLMPDHAHLLLVGLSETSDQHRAMSFLRRYTATMFLSPDVHWQRQAHDHVLRDEERRSDAFSTIAHYIVENPVRAGVAKTAHAWSYSGSMIAGWPDLDWRCANFWERWWKIFAEGER